MSFLSFIDCGSLAHIIIVLFAGKVLQWRSNQVNRGEVAGGEPAAFLSI